MSKFTPIDDELHAYMVEHGARQDDELRRVQAETEAMGEIAVMQIAPDQGAFMTLLARSIGARRALELGTFTGYSAICLARGLDAGGSLVCCELSEEYARIAAANFEAAGVADRIEVRVGPALDTLGAMDGEDPFDFAFIDADKGNYPAYYERVLELTRGGGLILVDNVLGAGRVLRPGDLDEESRSYVEAIRELNELMRDDERVDLAMVGIADGLMIARKR
ncbi:MAG: O-methyltransferase [Solirubrobacterales bacterium]